MTARWLEAIEARGFGGSTRAMMIREAQRTRFPGDLPPGFEFLHGAFVDLGFDRLGLTDGELEAVLRAFVGAGVAVPDTPFRLRFVRPVQSVVEPTDGSEAATLPGRWQQGVLVVNRNEKFTWIGKRWPRERLPEFNLFEYADGGDGWVRAVPIPSSGGGGDGHE